MLTSVAFKAVLRAPDGEELGTIATMEGLGWEAAWPRVYGHRVGRSSLVRLIPEDPDRTVEALNHILDTLRPAPFTIDAGDRGVIEFSASIHHSPTFGVYDDRISVDFHLQLDVDDPPRLT